MTTTTTTTSIELDELNLLAKTILGEASTVTHNPDALSPEDRQKLAAEEAELQQQVNHLVIKAERVRPSYEQLWEAARDVCISGAHPEAVARLQRCFAPYDEIDAIEKEIAPLGDHREKLRDKLRQHPAYICNSRMFRREADTAEQMREILLSVRNGTCDRDDDIPF